MKEKPFYMVFVDGMQSPTQKHETLQSAKDEAIRLYNKLKRNVYVLEPTMLIQPIDNFIVHDF